MHRKNYDILKGLKRDNYQKLYDLGHSYERTHYGCAQCTIGPFVEVLGVSEDLFSASSALAAGIAQKGDACGAYVGGVMIIGYLFGRTFQDLQGDHDEAVEKFRYNCEIARRLREKFIDEFGSINCRNVQCKVFGRSFDITDREKDYPEFIAQGAHTTKCPDVVGKACRMIAQVLLEEYENRFK